MLALPAAGAGLSSVYLAREGLVPAAREATATVVTRLRNITVALVALCVLALGAAPAYALDNDYHHVIRECYDTGQLPAGKYTRSALKKARRKLPSDIKEYSDCEDLINAALAAAARGNSTGGGGGFTPPPANPAFTTPSGAVASSQQDFDALKHQTDPKKRSAPPPQVNVAGSKLSPITGGLLNSARHASANSVPLPLILALAGLAALALFAAAAVIRQRWPETRRAALRLIGR